MKVADLISKLQEMPQYARVALQISFTSSEEGAMSRQDIRLVVIGATQVGDEVRLMWSGS